MSESARSSRVVGTGHYAPDRVLTNADLEKIVDTSDEWIVSRTGIRERRVAEPEQACSDLAVNAAKVALETAGVDAEQLDGIIVGTATGDMPFPAAACFVQAKLGATNAAAFDVVAACGGFIYSFATAHALIVSGQMQRVLVIGADILTRITDWEDRSTCVLFGDGAGAVVLEACEAGQGVLSTFLKTDGTQVDLLHMPSGGSISPASCETVERREHFIRMKGEGVFKYAVRAMADAATRVLNEANLTVDDVDWMVPHQANVRIIDSVYKRLGLPREKVVINIERYGNTSSGSIPLAFDEAIRDGRIKKGDVALLVTFGGGLSWGAILLRCT